MSVPVRIAGVAEHGGNHETTRTPWLSPSRLTIVSNWIFFFGLSVRRRSASLAAKPPLRLISKRSGTLKPPLTAETRDQIPVAVSTKRQQIRKKRLAAWSISDQSGESGHPKGRS